MRPIKLKCKQDKYINIIAYEIKAMAFISVRILKKKRKKRIIN